MTAQSIDTLAAAITADYRARTPGSATLFERARLVLPGGVSGNLRYFAPYPLYMREGRGVTMTDVDGNDYIDCFLCNGPLLLGHRPPAVMAAIAEHAATGPLVLNPALLIDCAERVCDAVPSAQRVRFVNSGTEALMSAVRYARGHTGRSDVVKFFGHYHGQDDQFLVGATPNREPLGKGVPAAAFSHTLTVPFNDIDALHKLLRQDHDVAAVVLDAAMHSGGLWGTNRDYLLAVREITRKAGVVLIFDEVITGFRMAPGGAQQHYDIDPDLTTLAKAMGAGEKIAAIAGKADIMSVVDPVEGDRTRRVFQSGTGNDGTAGLAAAMAAITTYQALGQAGRYAELEAHAQRLARGLHAAFAAVGIPCHVNQSASMLQIFLSREPAEFKRYSLLDQRLVDLFYLALITGGVLLSLPTSNHIYLSFAHGTAEIDRVIAAAHEVLGLYRFGDAFVDLT